MGLTHALNAELSKMKSGKATTSLGINALNATMVVSHNDLGKISKYGSDG